MQENILEANPAADIAVYVVWEPTLDERRDHAEEATALIEDPRVTQFWNEEFITGQYFSATLGGRTAWDIYFLYGPDASWEETPELLISSGFPVYSQRRQLQTDLNNLLAR